MIGRLAAAGWLALAGCAPWAGEDLSALGDPIRFAAIDHTCGIDEDGRGWCWGYDATLGSVQVAETCELPIPPGGAPFGWRSSVGCSTRPVAVGLDHRFDWIRHRQDAMFARGTDGTTWCWGDGRGLCFNDTIQRGWMDGPTGGVDGFVTPVQPDWGSTLGPLVDLSGSCVLTEAGEVWCYGTTGPLTLGSSYADDRICSGCDPALHRAQRDPDYVGLATNGAAGYLIRRDGALLAWGTDIPGRVLQDTGETCSFRPCAPNPVVVEGLPPVREVTADGFNVCVGTAEGVYCLGALVGSGPGDGPQLLLGEAWTDLQLVGDWLCGVDEAGDARCVGWSEQPFYYRIDRDLPSAIVDLSAGVSRTCAVTADREAWCWGAHDPGAFGDGTVGDGTFVDEPRQVGAPWRD